MFDLGKRKIALYARVSPGTPSHKGESVEAQLQRMQSYVQSRGWDTTQVELYVDEKQPSRTLRRREVQRMLKDVEQGRVGIVVVNRYDRFVRSTLDMIKTLEFFCKNQVDFISLTEEFDTTTPMGEAMFKIAAVFAELERKLAAARTDEVRAVKFANTGMFFGRQPLGFYRNSKKELVPDYRKKSLQYANKSPAQFIQYLFKLCAEENMPPYAMQKKLLEQGCEHFSVRQLSRLLSNRTYLGEASFKGLTKQDVHEPLVDRETFEKVKEILSKPIQVNHRLEREIMEERETLKRLYNIEF